MYIISLAFSKKSKVNPINSTGFDDSFVTVWGGCWILTRGSLRLKATLRHPKNNKETKTDRLRQPCLSAVAF
jgi:hypothetical protein